MAGLAPGDLLACGGFAGRRRISWAVSGRAGGASAGPFAALNLAGHVGDEAAAVAANRDRLATWAAADGGIAALGAVHGSRVAEVTGPGELEGCDGAVCAIPGIALLALGADCALAALADPDAGIVGVLHCGWRGLAGDEDGDVVANTVGAMRALGAGRIRAVLGPAICAPCYPVDAARAAKVGRRVPEASAGSDGRWQIDVRAGVRALLVRNGVEEVLDAGGCTAETDSLFSYRRAGGAPTGRHGLLVRTW